MNTITPDLSSLQDDLIPLQKIILQFSSVQDIKQMLSLRDSLINDAISNGSRLPSGGEEVLLLDSEPIVNIQLAFQQAVDTYYAKVATINPEDIKLAKPSCMLLDGDMYDLIKIVYKLEIDKTPSIIDKQNVWQILSIMGLRYNVLMGPGGVTALVQTLLMVRLSGYQLTK